MTEDEMIESLSGFDRAGLNTVVRDVYRGALLTLRGEDAETTFSDRLVQLRAVCLAIPDESQQLEPLNQIADLAAVLVAGFEPADRLELRLAEIKAALLHAIACTPEVAWNR